MEYTFYAKHWCLPVIKSEWVPSSNLCPSEHTSRNGPFSFHTYDLFRKTQDNLMPKNVVETTPRQSKFTPHIFTASMLHLIVPHESGHNKRQVILNLNDSHSDPLYIHSSFWIPTITDWWPQQEAMHTVNADPSTVERDVFCIILHGVRMETSYFLPWDVVSWRQSNTTGETLGEKDIIRQLELVNNAILAADEPV